MFMNKYKQVHDGNETSIILKFGFKCPMELWNAHLLIFFFLNISRSERFSTVCSWPSPDLWREFQSCKCEKSLWCLVHVCDMTSFS